MQARLQTIAATGKADTLDSALRAAMAHAEHQARRYRDRQAGAQAAAQRRKGYDCAAGGPAQGARLRQSRRTAQGGRAAGSRLARRSPFIRFLRRATVVEPHIVKSGEAIAMKPMTIEEAVKDAEFRDRDLLIFRNRREMLFVLHRRRDGQMELVEIP